MVQRQPAPNLAALDDLDGAGLARRWLEVTGRPVPRVSNRLLRLALAWEIQARASGGLPRRIRQRLEQRANGRNQTREIRPGMKLVREWNGELIVVTVSEDGTIRWRERTWDSLSAVARAVTGTRWSGPAFFGLRTAAAPEGRKTGSRRAAA
ncbi:DUF2924 domain-containing protein [Novosphingobium flavum]|uniref:DUF2924 domain-containing protein n=1 Tax=Novosphingobium flavum TaxID=1778672 RepID=A0A7X1FTV7_9SPHN|nr:DUF2924 domain-containing protein [Novosphingobium flavum]MBC2666744.1 DUF2924 domain-containing protein [Novosphingobium flavum]